MKIVQINAVCGRGSTGKICVSISEILTSQNIENYILYSFGKSDYPLGIKISSDKYIKIQALKSKVFGNYGFNSKRATKKIIDKLDSIQPDIVHIHNIHGHDCHLGLLFTYLKKKNIKIFWTFHDCWAFTGYCVHFTFVKCEKWKTECKHCPQRRQYSWFFDRSKALYNKKKEIFSGLDLTIITPSHWLAELVKQSFLKDYPVKVINNGIDLNIFKPTESEFREKVLVGTDDNTDKLLPDNIISIHRTQNQKELAEIYTAADLFVNPTREDNYPTVNMEALACGTPVLTFETGGSPESIDDTCGAVVECDNIDVLKKEIVHICKDNLYCMKACRKRAEEFREEAQYSRILALYAQNTK